MKKKIALLIAIFLIISLFPITALAAGSVITSDGTYDISLYEDNFQLTIDPGLTVTLTNTTNLTNKPLNIICVGKDTHLTVHTVSIKPTTVRALEFNSTGNTLTLIGDSYFESSNYYPGIQVSGTTELTILGSGSVTARGGDAAAGIGGGANGDGGTITISDDATVTANGGYHGAGIGGGIQGSGGTITISDSASVTAYGGGYGAGIGGSANGDGGTITISDDAKVNANGGSSGAGIGGGYKSSGGTITVKDSAIVTAIGGDSAAGIGGGYKGFGGTIAISDDATVTANGGIYGAGIGGGYDGSGGTITISVSASVTAYGGKYGAGIGGGVAGSGGTVTISGYASVTANGGDDGAGIGGGYESSGGIITISDDATVTANGGEHGAGIGSGSGNDGAGGTITISGGIIYAKKGIGATHDIGKSNSGDAPSIAILGDAKVFLKNDDSADVTTSSHTHFDITVKDENGKLYQIPIPSDWDEAGGYLIERTLSFDINGATGTAPDDITFVSPSKRTVPPQGDMENGKLQLIKWDTQSDGLGISYTPGKTFTFLDDTTLYAIWDEINVTSVSISDSEISVRAGNTSQLTATVSPSGATKNSVSWMTSDPGIAGVSPTGLVTGIKEGTATITAEADGITASCAVTVSKNSVASVSLSYGRKTMYVGDVFALSAVVHPDDATHKTIVWNTSDSSVATVTQQGVVTAQGKGTATITAEADGITDTCKMTVLYAPAADVDSVNITLETDFTAVMYIGDILNLNANIIPSDAAYQTLSWQSSDASVATVSSFGKVTALAQGTAQITVKAQDKSDTYSITVKAHEANETSPSPTPALTAAPTPAPNMITIDTSALPEGTKFIKLPNGDIVALKDDATHIIVSEELMGDGTIEIVALDGEKTPLGAMDIAQANDDASSPLGRILIIIIVSLLAGAGASLLVIRLLIAKKAQ